MRNNLTKKLHSNRGETLTETLCALLVVAIASVVLVSMVHASINMNAAANTQDDTFYKAVTAVETADSTNATSAETTINAALDGKQVQFDIVTYTFTDEASEKALTAYQPVVPAEPADANGEAGDSP